MAEHSPFDALEPMLATEGMENRARGYELFFQPFVLTPESVAPLRERILDIIFREICSPDLKRAVRAADALAHALRYPHGYFGHAVGDSQREGWTPEFVATLDRLATLVAQQDLDPIVTIAIRRTIQWHANHSSGATGPAARRVRDAIPDGADQALALALFDGWGHLSDDDAYDRDYQRAQAARQERADLLAQQLIASQPDSEVLHRVEERLNAQAALSSTRGNPGPFVWALVTAKPSLGIGLARMVVANPRSELLGVLATTLAATTEHLRKESIEVIDELVATGDLGVRRQVAQALGWNSAGRTTLIDGELNVLVRLAADGDEYVRTSVIRAAQRLAPHRRDAALRLLVAVPFADSTSVAEELFQTIGPDGGLDWRQLPKPQMDEFLTELVLCPSIEDHSIMTFLADFSSDRPDDLVQFLQRRVERAETDAKGTDYKALPYDWTGDLYVRDTPQFPTILRRLRGWITANADSWHRRDAGADLFVAVSGAFDETVMSILEEGVLTGDDNELIAVAAILEKAPSAFVFEQIPFVRRVLAAAADRSQEHLKRIGGALSSAASSGVRSGLAGEPFEEDVVQRDQAREIADTLPKGSPEERLYRSLEHIAEESIHWQVERDRDLLDGREW